ncbi:holocarboxylase synthetase 2 [Actinidia rufa]|uniref:Holocarboxylase synthetase 2 n=1 Tax=Actinidia rufa TaxID=165716 RepID=A0A7J0EFR7_9ERIC|nr:holocarboxylase synthetase 2 [Actinidia rufa]
MDSKTPSLLVLCGKSSTERELGKSLKDNQTLKLPENAEVSILLHSESENSFEGESFRINSFFNSLSAAHFGSNFCEIPVGSVCVSDVQFKGRGRSKNVWESPKGSLLFSFTIQMEDGRVVPLVQYVVSLAMTEAIKDMKKQNVRDLTVVEDNMLEVVDDIVVEVDNNEEMVVDSYT